MKANQKSFYSRFSFAILVAVAALTPLLFDAAFRAIRSNNNKVLDWLPATFVETGDLRWFRQHFSGDGFVVISWDGCLLGGNPADPTAEPDDPRIEQVAQALVAEPAETEAGAPSPRYFASVITGRHLLNRLTSPPLDVDYDAALKRLQGVVIGEDGRHTCLVATLTDDGIAHFRETLGRGGNEWLRFRHREGALFRTLRSCGIEGSAVHLGGPPVDNVAIDEEGERTLVRLAGLAGLVGLVLAAGALRSVRLTMIVFACGILSAAGALAAVWLTGQSTDAILMSMPALVYVLAMSGAVHLVNYYRSEVEQRGLRGAPGRAIAHGWKPAVLCSITTAIGLLSLYASDLTPIRKFGFYSALGVMLMLVVLFLFLPAALERWPITAYVGTTRRDVQRRGGLRGLLTGQLFIGLLPHNDFWARFGGWITRWHVLVTAACFLVIGVVGFGVTRVRTTIDLMKLFDSNARILQDYRWLEEHVGRLVPLEIVLRFDPQTVRQKGDSPVDDDRLMLLDRMRMVSQIQRTIAARFGRGAEDVVGPSMSAVTFVPPLPSQRVGTSALVRRSVTNSQLQQSYDALLNSGYLQHDVHDGAELWRISLRVAAFRDVDYARFSRELQAVVDPLIAKYTGVSAVQPYHPMLAAQRPTENPPRLAAVYTGVVPIVYKAQRELLDSLVQSTFWSFVTITPLLMFVARGGRAGMVAMLPNALPVLVVFGGMGWLKLPVDIGSMMSASIALGVAVDDTIHYLTWFREDLQRTNNRRTAILGAYSRCATPTLQAAMISGIGLSVFAFSTFTPTKQFGLLMLTILMAGAVAELIMLPALLAGPLGSAFTPSWRQRLDGNHAEPAAPAALLQESRSCLELDTPNCS